MQELEAVKHDNGKPKMALLPPLTLFSVASSFTHGAVKYDEYNYLHGMKWTRLYDAAHRHMLKWLVKMHPEDIDPDTKEDRIHHIDAAIASLMMLRESIHRNVGEDDRFKPKT